MDIVVAPGLAAIVRLGALVIEQVANASAEALLDPPLAAAEAAVRAHPPEESQAVRAMYRRIGLDPTKTRPSSEALLRRVRKGDRLPRINTLVDICNWCSLEFQLPYGLYDVAALEPPVTLRMGHPGESYPGYPERCRQRRRSPDAGRPGRAVWQPDLGLGTHDGHRGHDVGAGRRLCPGRDHAGAAGRPCSRPPPARLTRFAGGRQTLRAVI